MPTVLRSLTAGLLQFPKSRRVKCNDCYCSWFCVYAYTGKIKRTTPKGVQNGVLWKGLSEGEKSAVVMGAGVGKGVVFFYDLANLPMCGQQLAANDNWSRLTNAAVAKWMHFTTIEPMYEFQSVLP